MHPIADGRPVHLQIWASVIGAAVTISFGLLLTVCSYLGVELLDGGMDIIFKLSWHQPAPLSSNGAGHSSLINMSLCCLHYSHSGGCAIAFHCGLLFCFLLNEVHFCDVAIHLCNKFTIIINLCECCILHRLCQTCLLQTSPLWLAFLFLWSGGWT